MRRAQHSAALVALVTEGDGDEAVGGDDDTRREAEDVGGLNIDVSRFRSTPLQEYFTSVALLRAALISDAEEKRYGVVVHAVAIGAGVDGVARLC